MVIMFLCDGNITVLNFYVCVEGNMSHLDTFKTIKEPDVYSSDHICIYTHTTPPLKWEQLKLVVLGFIKGSCSGIKPLRKQVGEQPSQL